MEKSVDYSEWSSGRLVERVLHLESELRKQNSRYYHRTAMQ